MRKVRKKKMLRLKPNSHFDEDQKLIERMRQEYYSCPSAVKYIKSLKIPEEKVEEDIVKIYDFVSDLNFCKKCPGVSNCNKSTPRLCTKIVYEDGVISRELVPCKEYLKQIKFRNQFIVRDFDDDWLFSDLRRIDKSEGRRLAIEKYNAFLKGESSEWLYIMGEAGSGRTFLAANIALDIAKKEKGPIAFIDTPIRFKEIASKKDNDQFNQLVEKYSTVPVLILDDLGNEYKSDYVRENILFPILNARSKNHLMTIITSDFNINDVTTMYLTNQASKPKVEQIKRLLKRNCGPELSQGDLSIY